MASSSSEEQDPAVVGPCSTPGCEQPASLACPKCKKLGLPPSLFCSQACFKGNWNAHKALHKLAKQIAEAQAAQAQEAAQDIVPETLEEQLARHDGFEWTGDLRPHLVTPMRQVPPHIAKPDYALTGIPTSEQQANKRVIPVYNAEEIEGMRAVCRAAREVLDIAGRAVGVGVTADEIDRIVHDACVERNAYPSPLNYGNFPKSVCTSVNEVICHGIPDTRAFEDGDIVNLDVTLYLGGFHGDLNETFLVGAVDDESVRLVETAFACCKAGIETAAPGTMYRSVGAAISAVADRERFAVTRSYCGHGIGQLFHTSPNVPHYKKNKAVGVMRPGHIFTVEPMINAGCWQDVSWNDDWTAVTQDGRRSAQFEHTILITEDGYEILTAREDEPVMQWSRELLQR